MARGNQPSHALRAGKTSLDTVLEVIHAPLTVAQVSDLASIQPKNPTAQHLPEDPVRHDHRRPLQVVKEPVHAVAKPVEPLPFGYSFGISSSGMS